VAWVPVVSARSAGVNGRGAGLVDPIESVPVRAFLVEAVLAEVVVVAGLALEPRSGYRGDVARIAGDREMAGRHALHLRCASRPLALLREVYRHVLPVVHDRYYCADAVLVDRAPLVLWHRDRRFYPHLRSMGNLLFFSVSPLSRAFS
jgi:hypothetical protein